MTEKISEFGMPSALTAVDTAVYTLTTFGTQHTGLQGLVVSTEKG
jgi:hypothetical protein